MAGQESWEEEFLNRLIASESTRKKAERAAEKEKLQREKAERRAAREAHRASAAAANATQAAGAGQSTAVMITPGPTDTMAPRPARATSMPVGPLLEPGGARHASTGPATRNTTEPEPTQPSTEGLLLSPAEQQFLAQATAINPEQSTDAAASDRPRTRTVPRAQVSSAPRPLTLAQHMHEELMNPPAASPVSTDRKIKREQSAEDTEAAEPKKRKTHATATPSLSTGDDPVSTGKKKKAHATATPLSTGDDAASTDGSKTLPPKKTLAQRKADARHAPARQRGLLGNHIDRMFTRIAAGNAPQRYKGDISDENQDYERAIDAILGAFERSKDSAAKATKFCEMAKKFQPRTADNIDRKLGTAFMSPDDKSAYMDDFKTWKECIRASANQTSSTATAAKTAKLKREAKEKSKKSNTSNAGCGDKKPFREDSDNDDDREGLDDLLAA